MESSFFFVPILFPSQMTTVLSLLLFAKSGELRFVCIILKVIVEITINQKCVASPIFAKN